MNKKAILIIILLLVSIGGIILLKPYLVVEEIPEAEFTITQSYYSYRDDLDGEPEDLIEWNQKYKEGDEVFLNQLNFSFPEGTQLTINKISEDKIEYTAAYLTDCSRENDDDTIEYESSHFSKWLEITSCSEYGYFIFELEALY